MLDATEGSGLLKTDYFFHEVIWDVIRTGQILDSVSGLHYLQGTFHSFVVKMVDPHGFIPTCRKVEREREGVSLCL